MLQVDLRELARGPVETRAELAADDPLFTGAGVVFAEPIDVAGRLQATGAERFYWQGSVRTVVAGECRRCLAAVPVPVAAEVGVLFAPEAEAADDPDAYPLARDARVIDVTPAVREEVILAVPRYVLCREDCRGLCPRCGQNLNAGPCGCPPATAPRWQALAALKGKPRA
ncbi:MAG: YceD family protein [Gemmatimonadales bacterium]